jgi:hypothetical protein
LFHEKDLGLPGRHHRQIINRRDIPRDINMHGPYYKNLENVISYKSVENNQPQNLQLITKIFSQRATDLQEELSQPKISENCLSSPWECQYY